MLKTKFSSKVDLSGFGNELFNYGSSQMPIDSTVALNKRMVKLIYIPHWHNKHSVTVFFILLLCKSKDFMRILLFPKTRSIDAPYWDILLYIDYWVLWVTQGIFCGSCQGVYWKELNVNTLLILFSLCTQSCECQIIFMDP